MTNYSLERRMHAYGGGGGGGKGEEKYFLKVKQYINKVWPWQASHSFQRRFTFSQALVVPQLPPQELNLSGSEGRCAPQLGGCSHSPGSRPAPSHSGSLQGSLEAPAALCILFSVYPQDAQFCPMLMFVFLFLLVSSQCELKLEIV